jgi:uncharacterized protein (DUF1697 family)
MRLRYVALFRGINVGRAKRIPMVELRALVESLGYRNVRTLLNSGNVVFDDSGKVAGDPATRIEKAVEKKLGVSARVTVLSAAELAAVVRGNSLAFSNPSLMLVAFLNTPAERTRLRTLEREDWAPESMAVGTRAAYLWCPGGSLKGRLWPAVDKLGDAVTTRNWATVTKLNDLAAAD